MKKSLALILALVMLMGSVFAVMPMAEGETTESTYTPKIAYANLNYTDTIDMMFAVPAPATLESGASVKLLLWTSREDSLAFSYSDPAKIVIEAEATKTTIGGAEHLVFVYDDLGAHQMTNVICARPVVVKDDKAIAYGELVDYSVLEYVASARGEIDGVAGLSSDKAAALETFEYMLSFGAAAQKVYDDDYAYYADDELRRVYVTPVVKGVTLAKTFSGFFKPEEDDYFTLQAPFFDGSSVLKVFNAEGQELEDLDVYSEGFQLAAVDGDLYLTVQYSNLAYRSISADIIGPGFEVNNYDEGVTGGNIGYVVKSSHASISFSGWGYANFSGASSTSNYYWHSIRTIENPSDSEDQVIQITATHNPAFYAMADPISGVGVGDTIDPYITIEMELGLYNNKPITSGNYVIRHRVKAPGVDTASAASLYLFKIVDGVVNLYTSTGYTVRVGEVPADGLRKFAFVIAPIEGMYYAYVENENGEMEKAAETAIVIGDAYYTLRKNAYLADPEANAALSAFASFYNFFIESKLEYVFMMGATKGKDKFNDLMSGGVFTDMNAVKERALNDYSFLLDNYHIYAGRAYN